MRSISETTNSNAEEEVGLASDDLGYSDPTESGCPGEGIIPGFDPTLNDVTSASRTALRPNHFDPDCFMDQTSHRGGLEPVNQPLSVMELSQVENYMIHQSLTNVPAQPGLSLPAGHFPASESNESQSHIPVQFSMFSQHVEALELQARCQLDLAPDKASRQRFVWSLRTG